jgi:anti-anti-sigma factor
MRRWIRLVGGGSVTGTIVIRRSSKEESPVVEAVAVGCQDAVISHHHADGGVVITVVGEVDTLDADGLVECVQDCVAAGDEPLVLDCRDVSFVSVTVLARLAALRERLAGQGRAMRVRVPAGRVGLYFALVGF